MKQRNELNTLLRVGFWEGISYILLLGVAMPLKYYGGIPKTVSYTGMVHGVLFIAFMMLIIQALSNQLINRKQAFMLAFASILPLGTFFLDRLLVRKD